MNHDTNSTTEDTIQLPAFVARNTGEHIITKSFGTLTLKLNSNGNSSIKGTIDIEGQTIPILSRSRMSLKADKAMGNNSCILLLEIGQPPTNYKVGYIVDDVLDIPHIARESL